MSIYKAKTRPYAHRLNEVWSWRPEQCRSYSVNPFAVGNVSMKSGLGDRNNAGRDRNRGHTLPVSMKSGLGDRNNNPANVTTNYFYQSQ